MSRIETVCRENGGDRIVRETRIIIGVGVFAAVVIAIVEGAGRFSFHERPEAFLGLVAAFLQGMGA